MKKLIKKTTALIVLVTIMITYLPIISSAATIEWDGRSALKSGNLYVVSGETWITSDFIIPEDVIVNVKDGGVLNLSGGTLTIYGELAVSVGGEFGVMRGTVNVRNPGKLSIYGNLMQYIDTTIGIIEAEFDIYGRGVFKSSGILNVYPSSTLNNNGEVVLTSRNVTTVSGDVINQERGDISVQGTLTITKSGTLTNSGDFTISRNGITRNSGIFTLGRDSGYHPVGEFANSRAGVFIDNRYKLDPSKMTTSILMNEPRIRLIGIDVSYANGDINWERVASSGIDFAMIRAARGDAGPNHPMREDTHFKQNAEGAMANGIDFGVYFYSYARTPTEARREAEFLIDVIKDYRITYPIVYDIEEDFHKAMSKAQVTALVEAFFDVLKENGYFPMVYSYKSFLEDNVDRRILDTYSIWVAHWHVRSTTYRGDYHIWQYTEKGRVSGIRGDVDLSVGYYDFPTILTKHGLNHLR